MMRLVKVELGRLFSRRLFRAVVVLGLVGVLAVDGFIAAHSTNNVAAAQARAETMRNDAYTSCVAGISKTPDQGPTQADCDQQTPAGQLKDCLAFVARHAAHGPTTADCQRQAAYNPYFSDPRFHFADNAKNLLVAAAFLLMAAGLLVSASFVGAEWQAGTFASLLTWEPRRQRVMVAKLLAPVLSMAVLTAVVLPLLEAGAALAAGTRGTLDLTTSHLVGQLAVMGLRVVSLVALMTVIGGAIAVFTRHTVAVAGVIGGYLIAVELVGGMASTWWRQHELVQQLAAFVQGRISYFVDPPRGVDPGTWNGERFLHAGPAAAIVGALAVALVAIASVALNRRDVA